MINKTATDQLLAGVVIFKIITITQSSNYQQLKWLHLLGSLTAKACQPPNQTIK